VIGDSTKPVPALHPPVPLELVQFGQPAIMRELGDVTLREAPPSLDGGAIADYHAPFDDPAVLAVWLSSTPGVICHGLFEPSLVSEILIGRGDQVEYVRLLSAESSPRQPQRIGDAVLDGAGVRQRNGGSHRPGRRVVPCDAAIGEHVQGSERAKRVRRPGGTGPGSPLSMASLILASQPVASAAEISGLVSMVARA
jgi:hypothetical protein